MLPFEGGITRRVADIRSEVEAAMAFEVEGLTFLGGEPLAQAPGAAALARVAHQLGLSVMIFSGYTLEQARQLPDSSVSDLLAECDILVDGPYLQDLPETRRRWIGSTNQLVHFLSSRYSPQDPRWREPNTLELRLQGSELSVNGFPAAKAVGLWKRLPMLHIHK
jgi:anaerobic ribonucleoside-triphosphate reductase activating protein